MQASRASLLLLAVVSYLASYSVGQTTTLYISTTGLPTGDGSLNSPVDFPTALNIVNQTIQEAGLNASISLVFYPGDSTPPPLIEKLKSKYPSRSGVYFLQDFIISDFYPLRLFFLFSMTGLNATNPPTLMIPGGVSASTNQATGHFFFSNLRFSGCGTGKSFFFAS